MAERIDFTRVVGDSFSINLTFTEDGVAYDPSNLSFWFTVKENLSDLDADAIIQKSSVSITGNVATFAISASDTKVTPNKYWYDIQVKSGADIYTPIYGKITFQSEVTISG